MTDQSFAATLKSNDLELQKLRNKITDMDGLSQEGCEQISSIARLALASLEMAIVNGNFDDIATALSMISQKAGEIENCINAEAEMVGCNHVNEFKRSRQNRLHIAHNKAMKAAAPALTQTE